MKPFCLRHSLSYNFISTAIGQNIYRMNHLAFGDYYNQYFKTITLLISFHLAKVASERNNSFI